ncbi:MAG: tyrosine recombinase XerC [Limisphaerales bacterium]
MDASRAEPNVSFPHVVERRNGRATIYRREKVRGARTYVEYFLATFDTDGKRRLASFSDFNDALKAAEARIAALGRGLVEVTTLSGPARLDYLAAVQKLPSGVTLNDAADAWLRVASGPQVIPITVPELVAAFMASRDRTTRMGRPASPEYARDIERRLGKLSEAFPADNVDTLTTARLEAWIDATGQTGRHRFNTLRLVRTLLKWGQKRGHLPDGKLPTDKLEIVAPVDDSAIEIFTPQELARLLAVAKSDMIPFLALGAFAGLRTAEIHRLDWAAVKLERGFVEVGADKAKTKSRRLVPVLSALVAWLAPIRKPSGPVLPFANVAKQIGWVSRDSGVKWKHNGLRHSFVSYRVAATQSPDQTAFEAGNSAAMVYRHYRELVTPKEAEAWFSVMPAAPGNLRVVP